MQYRNYIISLFFILLLSLPSLLEAQTCSCAGAPLISSQSISTTSRGNLFVGLTYEFNEISTLYSEDNRLQNRSVERNTQSTLFEVNYGITDRLTVSGTATFVRKMRLGIQNRDNNDQLITRGIGDGLVLIKYVLHQNSIYEQYQLAAGAGTKIPFGVHSLSNNGIALNMDMQPGTGAWDGVFWSYFSKTFLPSSTVNFFLFNTYRLTGSSERFGTDDRYEFGNEWVVNTGITNTLWPNFSYIAMVNYRSTSSDLRNGQPLPNTGGKWINLEPAVQYRLTEGLSVKLSGKIPLYQYLNGTQPTTTYSTSLSLFYNFGKRTIF